MIGIVDFRYPWIGVLPEVEEFFVLLFLLIHREAYPAQQVLETRIGAQGIPGRYTDIGQVGIVLLIGLFSGVISVFVTDIPSADFNGAAHWPQ